MTTVCRVSNMMHCHMHYPHLKLLVYGLDKYALCISLPDTACGGVSWGRLTGAGVSRLSADAARPSCLRRSLSRISSRLCITCAKFWRQVQCSTNRVRYASIRCSTCQLLPHGPTRYWGEQGVHDLSLERGEGRRRGEDVLGRGAEQGIH